MGEQGEKLLLKRNERVEFHVKRCRWKQEKKNCIKMESLVDLTTRFLDYFEESQHDIWNKT